MGFLEKKKDITPDQLAEGLMYLVYLKITKTDKSFFDDLTKQYLQKVGNDEDYEINMREWEIWFFLASLLMIAVNGHCVKNVEDTYIITYVKKWINNLLESNPRLNETERKEFSSKIWQRYQFYTETLIDKDPGPTWYLSKAFLSILWFNHPDPEGRLIIGNLEEILYISEIFINLAEGVNNLFSQFNIIK
ncbi:MAG: hypothetical protein ACLP2P_01640 [Desulfobaccales bacterium]